MESRPLAGRRIVTTRDRPGRLDSLLAAAGADVVHVPLIEIVDAPGADVELAGAIDELTDGDWLVVTSRHGARRVGDLAATHPTLHLAAVGSTTADELARLAGRRVDVVPQSQTATDLAAAMPPPQSPSERVLVAQGDRADATLTTGLRARGFDVRAVTAYRNRLRTPSAAEREAALHADAVAFASGSAVAAWAAAFGTRSPRIVAVIGPATEQATRNAGLQVTHVAADHTVGGLVSAIAAAFEERP